jgi:hypothetical protein
MILDRIMQPKRYFNADDQKDINSFKSFLKNNAWGTDGCPFNLEEPYLTIPDMIKDKLVYKFLKVKKL